LAHSSGEMLARALLSACEVASKLGGAAFASPA
jgi:hypothetical protein